ncbi:MAG: MFS transporter [Betaproteobacteria bacterium]|nr:MFS transporter [Betaproteobacteria bacterium]
MTASTTPSLIVGLLAGTTADPGTAQAITINMIVLTATLILGAAIWPARHRCCCFVLTFIVGASFTFYMPAQSASVDELVAREELPRAIARAQVCNVARARSARRWPA